MPDMSDQVPASAPGDVNDYFSGLADAYAAHRPGYPPETLAALVAGLAPPIHAADIGCGTGISTRLLAPHCQSVIGIDPNEDMLDQARREDAAGTSSRIRYVVASAEATNLPDRSVDLIVCAQAFHWFDPEPTLLEFRRILKSGGRLGLMWNIRQNNNPFTSEYEATVHVAQAEREQSGFVVRRNREFRIEANRHFTNVQRLTFDNPQSLDWSGLIGRARSASYFPKAGSVRDELEARLRVAFEQHKQDGRVVLAQVTELTIAESVE